jgi:phosphatidylglycerol:prolipoprotein diacylglycerol transferase
VAFLADGALAARRLRELGKPPDWAYEFLFAAIVGGLVGARLDWVIQNRDQVDGIGDVVGGTGLVFFGGLLGGAIGVALWAWRRGFLGWAMVDLAAPAVLLGQAIGRVGCQLAGDGDYGSPSDLPWAMAYPEGTVPTTEAVHPTPVYETFALGLGALVLWHLRDRLRPGVLGGLYLIVAGGERFLVEFIRRNEAVLGPLTLAQLIGLAMVVAGTALIAWRMRAPVPVAA